MREWLAIHPFTGRPSAESGTEQTPHLCMGPCATLPEKQPCALTQGMLNSMDICLCVSAGSHAPRPRTLAAVSAPGCLPGSTVIPHARLKPLVAATELLDTQQKLPLMVLLEVWAVHGRFVNTVYAPKQQSANNADSQLRSGQSAVAGCDIREHL